MKTGLSHYLAQLDRSPLPAAEQTQLARRARAGDAAARGLLIESNLRLVVHIAKRFAIQAPAVDLEDLIAAGGLGLVRAADLFDPRRAVSFSSYAGAAIKNQIKALLREGTIHVPRQAVYTAAAAAARGPKANVYDHPPAIPDTNREVDDRDELQQMRHHLLGLTPRQREVVRRRYLHGQPIRTIAAALGVSRQAVNALLARATDELRRRMGVN